MLPTPTRSLLSCTIALMCLGFSLSAHALNNPRYISFNGQTVPAAPASNVTFVDANNGSMTVDQIRSGLGLDFRPGLTYYTVNNYPTVNVDTTFTITPAASSVPYRLNVGDMRASSYMNIGAKCLDAANPTGPWIQCNLTNTALFPRTINPPEATGTFSYLPEVYENWPSAGWVTVSTEGFINQNKQSNGLYIDLPPTVREVTIMSGNQARNNGDFTYATVFVADAPSVSKSFAPAAVKPGEQSTLTIALAGADFGKNVAAMPEGTGGMGAGSAGVAGSALSLQLTDLLPAPLTLVSATHTCTGGTLTAVAGSNTIELKDASLPNDGCTITAVVQWPATATGIQACQNTPKVTNTIDPAKGQFKTAVGQMNTPATADLSCSSAPVAAAGQDAQPVPGLGGVALWLTSLGLLGLGVLRKRKTAQQH